MPVIIERGTLPSDEQDWQFTITNKCQFCGTVYRLVEGDEFRKTSERIPGGRRELTSPCPVCSATVITNTIVPHIEPSSALGSSDRR